MGIPHVDWPALPGIEEFEVIGESEVSDSWVSIGLNGEEVEVTAFPLKPEPKQLSYRNIVSASQS
eukprot:JP437806.1.p2 GENE.JP437806.1~~JP437806.1.p2  ORF type:complete len:65 (-),score=5.60 JP437806.1:163-357(-)